MAATRRSRPAPRAGARAAPHAAKAAAKAAAKPSRKPAADPPGKRPERPSAKTPAKRSAKPAAKRTTRADVAAPKHRAASSGSVAQKLALYRSKRDFGRTPEPSGTTRRGKIRRKSATLPFFVIQKHDATRLHYDFRLEVDGVLKSWAVPKGPSMDPSDKRLAVQTEDHPMDYADFEGIIPEDEYGGGTVIVWDAGPYRNIKEQEGRGPSMAESWERGRIEVWLEGRKIRGGFALVHSRMGDNEKNWLLIKMKDTAANSGADPVTEEMRSVMSGRTIEEVARKPKKVWSSR